MHNQPKYRPLRGTAFFADGERARPLVEGTVARGTLQDDAAFFTGKVGTATVKELPFPGRRCGAEPRPGALQHLLHALPRRDRQRQGHGGPARLQGSRRRSTTSGCATPMPATSST